MQIKPEDLHIGYVDLSLCDSCQYGLLEKSLMRFARQLYEGVSLSEGAGSHMPVNPELCLMCSQCVFASKPVGQGWQSAASIKHLLDL